MKSRRPEDNLAISFLSIEKRKRTKLLENIEKAKQFQWVNPIALYHIDWWESYEDDKLLCGYLWI